ncbi:MAG: hypothetical protein ACM3JC_16595 [Rudaea sp.]
MKALQSVAGGMAALFFACALPAHGDSGRASASAPIAGATACEWTRELAPDRVRSPVQMDLHAAYRIFAFKSDGSVGFRVRSQFPYAAFLSYTVYDQALVHAALIDHEIDPDEGSINPFRPNALVHATPRSYTVTVLPAGAARDAPMANPIFMPPLPRHANVVTVVLVQRIYLPEPGQDRFGGFDAPTIEPFLVDDPATPAACPGDEVADVADQFGSLAGHFSQSPLPRDGRIRFYRPPVTDVPFADGDGFQDKHDCTGYLMATVLPDRLAVVRLPKVPDFFDNTDIGAATTFVPPAGVRYLSLGSYGASVMGVLENENIAGPEVRTLPDGSATFVAIPLRTSLADAADVINKADQLGYNVMPLAEYGSLIPDDSDGPQINPFLIYRNKVASEGFPGDIKNVACFQGTSFSHAPRRYAASPANMGEYAPVGVECSVADFVYGSCGQDTGASP